MLLVKNLHKSYGKKKVLNDLSFMFPSGTLALVYGPNGVGKTTLFKCLSMEIPFDSGEVSIHNQPLQQYADSYYHMFSVLHDKPFLYPYLTGREYIDFVLTLKNCDPLTYEAAINQWIKDFDIQNHEKEMCLSYSLGTRRKFYLLPQLIIEPSFVLADEPFNGLDAKSRIVLAEKFRSIANSGGIVLVITHDIEDIAEIFDKALLLSDRGFKTFELNKSNSEIVKNLFTV